MSKSSKIIEFGLTYDDVLLVPAYSETLPRDVCLKSKFSRNISLNIPVTSAAMDTVTESSMAIAMAREGGIGVVHKNLSIDKQAREVKKVKRYESGLIIDPVTMKLGSTLKDAEKIMKEYSIGGIPIVDEDDFLKGIITNRDLRFQHNLDLKIEDVMTKENLITVKEGTTLKQAEEVLKKYKIEKLPVVDKNSKLIGLITFRDIQNLKENPHANKDKFGRLCVAAAIGVTPDALQRAEKLVSSGVDALVIDTAHGHHIAIVQKLKEIKSSFPNIDIIAGNIATKEGAKHLLDAGADGIKVGIGPGSICTTRIVTGVGYPQLSAILNVTEYIGNSDVSVIADGGIKFTGDVSKALVAGADAVMMGSLLAGTKESPGEAIIYEGRKFKSYRGMGSIEAMEKGAKDRYFQDTEEDVKKFVPEGIVGRVPYKGELKEIMYQFIGGLRASMGYTGSKNIQDLKKANFVQITSSGLIESHPHSINIVKEAPNYSR